MRWLDYSLLCSVTLAAACSDDGFAPADTSPLGSTSRADSGADSGENTGGGSGNETGEIDPAGSTDDTGPSGSEGGTGPEDGTTGEPPPQVCEVPEDCVLVNDCCRCEVFPAEAPVPECRENCRQPTCEALGVPPDLGLACEDGECGWEPRNCSPVFVTCDAPTPMCSDGLLPEVTPEGDCWTGACIPVEACETVPDCEYCEDDETCVANVTQLGPELRCVPLPEACMGTPTCECMPPDTCEAPFDLCSDDGGTIDCGCPAC